MHIDGGKACKAQARAAISDQVWHTPGCSQNKVLAHRRQGDPSKDSKFCQTVGRSVMLGHRALFGNFHTRIMPPG